MNKGEVFVVDDEVGIRLLLSEIIEQQGFRVTLFDQSEDALEQAINQKPELIFLDYLIEPIRGDKFVKQLKEKSTEIKVVLMSGMAEQEVKKSLGDTSVDRILEKPFSVSDIQEILKEQHV